MFIMGDGVLEPRNCTSADIVFAAGKSHITRRESTDPDYEFELLLKSIILLDTNTHHRAVKTEHRVFRLQNGDWSYWDADEKGVVRRKIRDLQYMDNSLYPKFTATDKPWVETDGNNRYLGLEFHLDGDEPALTITHRVRWGNGRETVEVTMYSKVGDFKHEGWSKWLMENMKAGYQRWQAYGSEAKD